MTEAPPEGFPAADNAGVTVTFPPARVYSPRRRRLTALWLSPLLVGWALIAATIQVPDCSTPYASCTTGTLTVTGNNGDTFTVNVTDVP